MTTDEASADQPEHPPLLRVINADATPEEVAALVAVFSALGSGGGEAPEATPPGVEQPRPGRTTHAPPRPRRLAGQRPAAVTRPQAA